MCIRERGPVAPDTALFPIPVPCLSALRDESPSVAAASRAGSSDCQRVVIWRTLHVVVMSLNFLHADFRHVPSCSLGRHPNATHDRIYARLRKMLWACSRKGVHPLSSGRRGPNLIARLRELDGLLSSVGLSTFAYPRQELAGCLVPHCADGPEALRPYREVDPARLKISRSGSWALAEHLGPELLLPYQEPKILRSIPPNLLPHPDAEKEDRLRTCELLKLWDSRGLLYLSFEEKAPRDLTRVFAAYKDESFDRQIGDRRGGNSLEGKVYGPSRSLPPGHSLIGLSIPKTKITVGASTDRADFYHQSLV